MNIDMNEQHWMDKKCPPIDCRKKQCECGLEKVFLSAALGDDSKDSPIAPKNGEYCNAIVVYEANGHMYIYSKEGIPTLITSGGGGDYDEIIEEIQENLANTEDGLAQEILDRIAGDNTLQDEIDAIKNSPDVVDIVATYAALQAYDTSELGDNDIVRVLADEQHGGASTYYRWNKQSSTWTYIGEVGDYYTKGQVDDLLDDKQDTLTAGANISIENDTISATYTHFTGATASTDGTQGLVPAPIAGDEDKFLKADGTWDTVSSGPTVVQTTGTSTTDVMSQNATTSMVYADPANKYKVQIGDGATAGGNNSAAIGRNATANGNNSLALGFGSTASGLVSYAMGGTATNDYSLAFGVGSTTTGDNALALGNTAIASGLNSVALGYKSKATAQGEINVGLDGRTDGYGNTAYRLISGVHDPVNAQDAATKAYVDAQAGGPTVVQNTGTSTTDVMSQNATTSMVYADPNEKRVIRIGDNSSASNFYTIGIGWNSRASGEGAVALGGGNTTYNSSYAAGDWSVAIGTTAKSEGAESVALGADTTVTGAHSVALGDHAKATQKGQVDISTQRDNTTNTLGYNNSSYRLLTGLYDPQSAHDAATKGYVDSIVVNYATLTAAGAPTTSTAAVSVGQLYYDSTNDDYYYCSAIDTTDPQNPIYTWSALSTGGGSITPVQTTGTSTTDVMSQNAVTSMVFADPSTASNIRIGNTNTTASSGVNIGQGAYCNSNYGVSIGAQANTGGSGQSIAIGPSSRCQGNASVALGYNARQKDGVWGAVSLGSFSSAQNDGEINIESVGNPSYGYNNTTNRLVRGVYDGQNSNDAVNVSQVNSVIDNINSALNTNIPHIGAST